MIITIGVFADGIVRTIRDYLRTKKAFVDKPLDSYAQVVAIFIFFVCGIIVFTTLTGKSPYAFLISLGAASAVLMLVFKDTILGVVASVQVSANEDRKSTRLNSSHVAISYAVFCLKKKYKIFRYNS